MSTSKDGKESRLPERIRIREVIVVEGRYDRNAVSQVADALIFETGGFSVFRNAEKCRALQLLAANRGVIILTDSDSAGFVIRNHLRGFLPPDCVRNAYVPAVPGKERRKDRSSREGILGVEGMSGEAILRALRGAGATEESADTETLTTADFYKLGLSGRTGAAEKRKKLAVSLGLPAGISQHDLRRAVGFLLTREELERILDSEEG